MREAESLAQLSQPVLGLLVQGFDLGGIDATGSLSVSLSETAMRLEEPLPPSRLPMALAIGVAVIATLSAVLVGIDVT